MIGSFFFSLLPFPLGGAARVCVSMTIANRNGILCISRPHWIERLFALSFAFFQRKHFQDILFLLFTNINILLKISIF